MIGDIYNRPRKLEHWKNRTKKELDSSDLTDVFKLIEHMEDIESSMLWIGKIYQLSFFAQKQLRKPVRDAKTDIKKLKFLLQKK